MRTALVPQGGWAEKALRALEWEVVLIDGTSSLMRETQLEEHRPHDAKAYAAFAALNDYLERKPCS